MMTHTTSFALPAPGAINGGQLAQEILDATGVDVRESLTFVPQQTVRIPDALVGDSAAAIQAVVDAHDPQPTPRTMLTRRKFSARFTDAEHEAVRLSADPAVQRLRTEMMIAAHADLDDAELIGGLQYLEATGVIGQGRAAEIMDPSWSGS